MQHVWNQRFRLLTTIAETGLLSHFQICTWGRLPITGENIFVSQIQESELAIHLAEATWKIESLSPQRLSKHEGLTVSPTLEPKELPTEPGIYDVTGKIRWNMADRFIKLELTFHKKAELPPNYQALLHAPEPVLR